MISLNNKFKSFAERMSGTGSGKIMTPEIEQSIVDELEKRTLEYKIEQIQARRLYGDLIKG